MATGYLSRATRKHLREVNGIFYPGSEERFHEIRNMDIKPDDVALVTYPNSGTHWVHEILSYLRDPTCNLDRTEHQRCVPLEIIHDGVHLTPVQMVDRTPSPRTVVTHLPYELCPLGIQQGKCKILYVVRNPKDTAVSRFHFLMSLPERGNFADFEWNDYFEVSCKENILAYGSWFNHVKNWLPRRNDDNVMFITYEELKMDTPLEVIKMAAFLGRDISVERAGRIAELCDFKQMRSQAEAADGDNSRKSLRKATAFFRKGKAGGWKEYFTVAQNEAFDNLYRNEMEGIELDIKFET